MSNGYMYMHCMYICYYTQVYVMPMPCFMASEYGRMHVYTTCDICFRLAAHISFWEVAPRIGLQFGHIPVVNEDECLWIVRLNEVLLCEGEFASYEEAKKLLKEIVKGKSKSVLPRNLFYDSQQPNFDKFIMSWRCPKVCTHLTTTYRNHVHNYMN